jgi:hypothetical protein
MSQVTNTWTTRQIIGPQPQGEGGEEEAQLVRVVQVCCLFEVALSFNMYTVCVD